MMGGPAVGLAKGASDIFRFKKPVLNRLAKMLDNLDKGAANRLRAAPNKFVGGKEAVYGIDEIADIFENVPSGSSSRNAQLDVIQFLKEIK